MLASVHSVPAAVQATLSAPTLAPHALGVVVLMSLLMSSLFSVIVLFSVDVLIGASMLMSLQDVGCCVVVRCVHQDQSTTCGSTTTINNDTEHHEPRMTAPTTINTTRHNTKGMRCQQRSATSWVHGCSSVLHGCQHATVLASSHAVEFSCCCSWLQPTSHLLVMAST